MPRRIFIKALGTILLLNGLVSAPALSQVSNPIDEPAHPRASALFPHEIVRVPGVDALHEWERLKSAGRGAPVVIGGDENLSLVLGPLISNDQQNAGTTDLEQILARADQITHPDELIARYQDDTTPTIGEWPDLLPVPPDFDNLDFDIFLDVFLAIFSDEHSGSPPDHVNIIIVDTDDWTTIPAHLRWGGWNANPLPEFHVAALRAWRDRYGAELVGLGPDFLLVHVASRPSTREQAMTLARELYIYNYDVVDQGVGTLSNLAASLMVQDWWFFWWD